MLILPRFPNPCQFWGQMAGLAFCDASAVHDYGTSLLLTFVGLPYNSHGDIVGEFCRNQRLIFSGAEAQAWIIWH
jgi:hypothetical protein